MLVDTNEGLYAQPERQLAAVRQFDERLEDLRVDPLGRLVGANVLPPEQVADAHDLAREAAVAEGIRGDVRRLADRDPADVGLVDVDADAAHAIVGQRHDRRVELRRHALAGLAVAAGRRRAGEESTAFFIDDENSWPLFYGYAVAAARLASQCEANGIAVNAERPLFVYLPCGVGGAPSGITYGLKQLYGNNVHCFFVEPDESACFLAQMQLGSDEPRSVYDLGMTNRTEADGLAVGQASLLAVREMRTRLAGIVTTSDDMMLADLATVYRLEGHAIEPSAAAGFSGPRALFGTAEGARYIEAHGPKGGLADATHIVWTTGGRFLPPEEHRRFLHIASARESVS